jgi:hypothetical protein
MAEDADAVKTTPFTVITYVLIPDGGFLGKRLP